MDSLERVSHPCLAGQLSPTKSNNSTECLGGGKRDSAYSSFSTSSGTPDYTLSKSDAASTENILHKFNQWDSGGKQNSGQISQSMFEGAKQDDKLTYSQVSGVGTGCEVSQTDDMAGSRHSTSSRTSFGPIWHVPEKKKAAPPSPPPPPPPTRSDSYAATRVHDRGHGTAQSEGPESNINCKPSAENRHSLSPKINRDSFHTSQASDKSIPKQFSSYKQYSLSSSDVPQGHPCHQRHHSDKGTLFSQPWATSVPKPQNLGAYYWSMQELPINGSVQHISQSQRRNLSTSSSATATDQNTDISGQSRYYCVTTCQANQSKAEDPTKTGTQQNSLSPQSATKVKCHLPQQQQHSLHIKDTNGYSKHQVGSAVETCGLKTSSNDRGSQRGVNTQTADAQFMSYTSSRQFEQRRSLPLQHRETFHDIRNHNQTSNKICPQTTPLLHSLSMDAAGQELSNPISDESLESKQMRRSDRFATTLRNEIQLRKAQLQKSKSVAALPDTEGETEDDQDIWKSTENITPTSADGSFTNTYKVNLKEAQARVLKATSFRRKDLEPVLIENTAAENNTNYPSSALTCKDVPPLPPVLESVTSKPGPASSQVSRIGGRKRFPTEKKVRSFSEPNKIYEVGVMEDLSGCESSSSSQDQGNPFKESGKSSLSSHVPPQNCSENRAETKASGLGTTSETEDAIKGFKSREHTVEVQRGPHSAHKLSTLEQQRLGTFAEYEAKWNMQGKKTETRGSSQYRSADNILNSGPEERTEPTCFHERSRSSPSADIYGQVRL